MVSRMLTVRYTPSLVAAIDGVELSTALSLDVRDVPPR